MKTTDCNPDATAAFSPAPCSASITMLKCDHVSWTRIAILSTPAVATMCAISTRVPAVDFLAGIVLGVWLCQWQVCLWVWLTRRLTPNDKVSHGDTRQ